MCLKVHGIQKRGFPGNGGLPLLSGPGSGFSFSRSSVYVPDGSGSHTYSLAAVHPTGQVFFAVMFTRLAAY